MNIVIGMLGTARELALEVPLDEAVLASRLNEAVNDNTVLDLTDSKGQRVLIPARSIAFIQVIDRSERRVGFAIS